MHTAITLPFPSFLDFGLLTCGMRPVGIDSGFIGRDYGPLSGKTACRSGGCNRDARISRKEKGETRLGRVGAIPRAADSDLAAGPAGYDDKAMFSTRRTAFMHFTVRKASGRLQYRSQT